MAYQPSPRGRSAAEPSASSAPPAKISPVQVVASAVASVLAAVVASLFGEKGTIIGVALVSVIATVGSAAIARSLRRGHEAVRQAVPPNWRVATANLRTSGGGAATESGAGSGRGAAHRGREPGTPAGTLVRATPSPSSTAVAGASRVRGPGRPGGSERHARRSRWGAWRSRSFRRAREIFGVRWPILAGATAIVFVIALGVITLIELGTGQSLSNSVGGSTNPNGCLLVSCNAPASPSPTTTTTPSAPTSTTPSTSPPSTARPTPTTSAPAPSTTVPSSSVPRTTTSAPPATTTAPAPSNAPAGGTPTSGP